MEFAVTEDMLKFIELVNDGHENLGPTDLILYYIKMTKMTKVVDEYDGRKYMVFEVHLGRRLLGTVLTVFIPTILLNLVGHSTNYFKAFFMNILPVNLTVMLVITTMFVNISNRLPATSYIRMVDVWLIFNLVIPFVEVVLHTYKAGKLFS